MKEYFARFKYLYITLVVILVVTIAATAVYMTKQKAAAANKGKRMNTECLTDERVFDYADMLTDTTSAINNLLDAVCDLTDVDPYEAYKTYVMQVASYMAEREAEDSIGIMVDPFSIMIIALIVAVSYVLVNLKKQEGKRTTTASTYVERTPVMNNQVDQFMTKSVTKRKIETSSSSGGGGHSGGGGGHHVSSGGHSHGGGGRHR